MHKAMQTYSCEAVSIASVIAISHTIMAVSRFPVSLSQQTSSMVNKKCVAPPTTIVYLHSSELAHAVKNERAPGHAEARVEDW